MNRDNNPYPECLIDETSGIELPDIRHGIWLDGYRAGSKNRPLIKEVIKAPDGTVLVFDDKGEQVPAYQGWYTEVKPDILAAAPPTAVFRHLTDHDTEAPAVPREEW